MRRTLLLCAGLALAACHDSSGGAKSFDATVTNLIQNGTSDATEPIEVNGQNFSFPTAENAFDDVLPPDGGAIVPQ